MGPPANSSSHIKTQARLSAAWVHLPFTVHSTLHHSTGSHPLLRISLQPGATNSTVKEHHPSTTVGETVKLYMSLEAVPLPKRPNWGPASKRPVQSQPRSTCPGPAPSRDPSQSRAKRTSQGPPLPRPRPLTQAPLPWHLAGSRLGLPSILRYSAVSVLRCAACFFTNFESSAWIVCRGRRCQQCPGPAVTPSRGLGFGRGQLRL